MNTIIQKAVSAILNWKQRIKCVLKKTRICDKEEPFYDNKNPGFYGIDCTENSNLWKYQSNELE